tara:strand:+ start:992 stop:1675 length:684 start_codon:yes stop_codon:yes gene_type:complete
MIDDWFNIFKTKNERHPTDKSKWTNEEFDNWYGVRAEDTYAAHDDVNRQRQAIKNWEMEVEAIGDEFAEAVKGDKETFEKCCKHAKLLYLRLKQKSITPNPIAHTTVTFRRKKDEALIRNTSTKKAVMKMDCLAFYKLLAKSEWDNKTRRVAEVFAMKGYESHNTYLERPFRINFSAWNAHDKYTDSPARQALALWVTCMNNIFKIDLYPSYNKPKPSEWAKGEPAQ